MSIKAQKAALTLRAAVEALRRGDSEVIEESLNSSYLTQPSVCWAANEGILDSAVQVREFAARILVQSEVSLTVSELLTLEGALICEADPIIQYWLAMALMERGINTPLVQAKLEELLDVGREEVFAEAPAFFFNQSFLVH